jgi:hypothetical protein
MQASRRLHIYLLVAFECFYGRWFSRDLSVPTLTKKFSAYVVLSINEVNIRHSPLLFKS